MREHEKMLLEDAIETAIRAEKGKLRYRNWMIFFGIMDMVLSLLILMR